MMMARCNLGKNMRPSWWRATLYGMSTWPYGRLRLTVLLSLENASHNVWVTALCLADPRWMSDCFSSGHFTDLGRGGGKKTVAAHTVSRI